MRYLLNILLPFLAVLQLSFAEPSYRLGRVKYNGGGDWYANRTALTNLIAFSNKNIGTNFHPQEGIVELSSPQIVNFPFLYLTGHGNIVLNDLEVANLRKYLINGGFLHIDDNYGLDSYIRPQMKSVFPELTFQEIPNNHSIYNQKFKFPNGLPKIHEHDGKPPKGYGLFWKGRLICFYSFETDLGNGWEDAGTYPEDTPEKRESALRMGTNLIQYALTN